MNLQSEPTEKPLPPELQGLERVTALLDTQFRIPFTQIRFGLDPVIGLFPVAGDVVGYLIAGGLLLAMVRKGVSGVVVLMMLGNILLDFLVGAIPVLGIIFDVSYKANRRNFELLCTHYEAGKYHGSAWPWLLLMGVVLLGILIGLVYLAWWLLMQVGGFFAGV